MRADSGQAPPPSLPYKVDTSRPSLRTNWTRLVPFAQVRRALLAFEEFCDSLAAIQAAPVVSAELGFAGASSISGANSISGAHSISGAGGALPGSPAAAPRPPVDLPADAEAVLKQTELCYPELSETLTTLILNVLTGHAASLTPY